MLAAQARKKRLGAASTPPTAAVPWEAAAGRLPLLERLRQRVGAVTPVGEPRPVGTNVSNSIDPRIPIQLHVLANPLSLADMSQAATTHPDLLPSFFVKEIWVGADGSFWVEDRLSDDGMLWWVNDFHPISRKR